MLRMIKKLPVPRRHPLYCFSSAKNTPVIIAHENPKMHKFLPQLYGLQLQNHILPRSQPQQYFLSQEQYQFYKKVSPNYVVVLIKKVVDQIYQDENANPIDQFYKVSTYCHVSYMENNNIILRGLHKVGIQTIDKVAIDTVQNKEPTAAAAATTTTASVEAIEEKVQEKGDLQVVEEPTAEGEEQKLNEEIDEKEGVVKNVGNKNMTKKVHPNRIKPKRPFYYSVGVQKIQDMPYIQSPKLQIKFKYLLDCFIKMSGRATSSFIFNMKDINITLNDIAAQSLLPNPKKQLVQQYLQATNPEERIDSLIKIVQRNTHLTHYYQDIENQAKNSIRNKKFFEFYSEVMKIAKQKLDGKKSKQLFVQKCVKSFESMNPSKQITQTFMGEIQRFGHLDQNSMQAGIIKSYIEELSKIPYNVQSEQIFDLQFAQKVMDEQHCGMKEVKDAILEIIAVGKLKKSLKGKIFCFIGGPGLGKTSFAKSVAKALNRKFYNISLGGVTDSSVLKGHRRTYIGAYSGKIIQALKNCGTNNPVILLDQIDKMGNSYHGDPRSQLLQILDPNQNNSFVDNYVDVPVDLSNVLFITSANYERNISKPLLDRMQKIYLTSYTKSQKVQIFNKHLLRRAIQKSGVLPEQFSMPPEVIDALVEEYSLGEPGVRYLQKHALSLLQKVAYKMLTNEQTVPIKITKQNLHTYLGNSYYRRKDHNKIGTGVAISLGGGDYGSRLTYIEAFKRSFISRKQISRASVFTGSLGDVFKEAMSISFTYARNFLLQNFNNRYLYENEVHVHAPEGASKKDGSTDSMTIVASLVSLSLNTKVRSQVAMTGEITLNGHVLRTSGIKEKVMVAKRQRIRQVILPKDNQPDVENLPKDITEGINFHYVSNFSQAFAYLFPEKNMQAKADAKAEARV